MWADLYANRVAVLATMHQKEKAIAPILTSELGIQIIVPPGLNTDQFGTFTREMPRPADQRSTARLKAEAALVMTGETLAIASEGSFGPHPAIPYLPCNREIVLLLDRENDLELVGEVITTATNYSHRLITTLADACEFATTIGFPEHGLVVMPDPKTGMTSPVFKGVSTQGELTTAVMTILQKSSTGCVHLETDMRAMHNPTRMRAIAQATENLLEQFQHCCPRCNYPGFEIRERRSGLPCMVCGSPTSLIQLAIYSCDRCLLKEEHQYPDGIQVADPSQCFYCNP